MTLPMFPFLPVSVVPQPPLAWRVFWARMDQMRTASRDSVGPYLLARAQAKRARRATRP